MIHSTQAHGVNPATSPPPPPLTVLRQPRCAAAPAPPPQALLAQIVTLAQFGAIALALVGEQVAGALGFVIPPHLLATLREKRMVIIMGAWFAGSMINNALVSTGAFEIFYDGDLVGGAHLWGVGGWGVGGRSAVAMGSMGGQRAGA